MKKVLKCFSVVLSVVLILCMTTACTEPAGEQAEGGMQLVRISEVTHSVFYAPQYAAINLGFFEDEGLEVELMNAGGADKVMTSVVSGSADIGFAGPEACVYVYNEGRDDYCKVFAQVTKRDGSFLIGREKPDGEFDWSSLKGKTVLPGRKGGVPYMALEYVMKNKGLTIGTDVIFDDSVQFDLMASAFMSGTGDYVTAFEPVATSIEQEGKGYVVAAVGEQAGDIPYTAYFASKSYIEENSDIIQKFTNALYKGQKWVEENDAKTVAEAISPSFPDTDTLVLASAVNRYKEIGAYCTDPVMSKESFDKLQSIISDAGELDKKAPYEEIVDVSFAQEAMK